MRGEAWLYPAAETIHIVCLALVFGMIAVFDLRLLGFGSALSVGRLARLLLPIVLAAFCGSAVTGFLLVLADPVTLLANPLLRWKLVLIGLAGINATLFHFTTFRSSEGWDLHAKTPWRARVSAIFSLVLWLGVIAAGRLIAYL